MEEARESEVEAEIISEGLKIIDNIQYRIQQYYCEVCKITLPHSLPSALQHCNGAQHTISKKQEIGIAIAEGVIKIINKVHYCNICNINIGFGLNETLSHYKEHKKGAITMGASKQSPTVDQVHATGDSDNNATNSLGLRNIVDKLCNPSYKNDVTESAVPRSCLEESRKRAVSGLNADVPDFGSKKIKIVGNKYYCGVCKIHLPLDTDLHQHCNGRIHEMELLIAQGVITLIDRQSYCVICKMTIGFRYRAALNHYKNMHKREYKKMLASKRPQPDNNFHGTGSTVNTTPVRNIVGTSGLSSRNGSVVEKQLNKISAVDDLAVENSASKIKVNAEIRPKGFKIVDNKYYCEVCKINLPIDVDLLQHCYGRKHEIELLIAQGLMTIVEKKCQCEVCKKNIGFGYRAALNHFRNLHKEEYRKMLASKQLEAVGKFYEKSVNGEPVSKKIKENLANAPENSANVPNIANNVSPNFPETCNGSLNLSNTSITNVSSSNNVNIVAPKSPVSSNSASSLNSHTSRSHRSTNSRNTHQRESRNRHHDHDDDDDDNDRSSRDRYHRHKSDRKEKRDAHHSSCRTSTSTNSSLSNTRNRTRTSSSSTHHSNRDAYLLVDSYPRRTSSSKTSSRTQNDHVQHDIDSISTKGRVKSILDLPNNENMSNNTDGGKVNIKQEEAEEWVVSSSYGDNKIDNIESSQGDLEIKEEIKQEEEEEWFISSSYNGNNVVGDKISEMDMEIKAVAKNEEEEEEWLTSSTYGIYY